MESGPRGASRASYAVVESRRLRHHGVMTTLAYSALGLSIKLQLDFAGNDLQLCPRCQNLHLDHQAIGMNTPSTSVSGWQRRARRQLCIRSVCTVASFAWLIGASHAQGNATCADFPNEFATPKPKDQPINNPGTQKPSDPNSVAVKAAQAKKAQYLKCTPTLLSALGTLTVVPKEPFDRRVVEAVKAKKNLAPIARAVYIIDLATQGTIAKTDFGDDPPWWKVKYVEWCSSNDPGGIKKLPLPKPTPLVQSIAELDAGAIPLGWARVEKVDGELLKGSCDESLRALVKRAASAK